MLSPLRGIKDLSATQQFTLMGSEAREKGDGNKVRRTNRMNDEKAINCM